MRAHAMRAPKMPADICAGLFFQGIKPFDENAVLTHRGVHRGVAASGVRNRRGEPRTADPDLRTGRACDRGSGSG